MPNRCPGGRRIANSLAGAGYTLNHGLVLSAALLHDLARGEKNHAQVGAERLRRLGYPEVAEIVAIHMDLPVNSEQVFSEASIVYLADKLVKEDKIISLERRLRETSHKYASEPLALEAVTRRLSQAENIKREIEKAISLPLEKIIL
ncbi:hypothetical protein N752_28990 [Desulforamulus aquiferis]|nr:HD domain-containing protein [Desulforamulus aquiferis]RYD01615.1 hypothetical protein N752_28990 [Desulforamulus aquiferis]